MASAAEPLMLGGWANGRSDEFVRSGDNKLYHRYTDPVSEHGWMYIGDNGVPLASDPAVASWGAGRADLFVINQNNTVDHGVVSGDGDGFTWSDNWSTPFDGAILSGIDVASSARGVLDLIVVTNAWSGNWVWHRRWDNGADTGWVHFGDWSFLDIIDSPAIASHTFQSGSIDVFLTARTSTSSPYTVFHSFMDPGLSPSAWQNLGAPPGATLVSGVDAASWGPSRIDVVVNGADGAVNHLFTDNLSSWGWNTWGGFPAVNSNPSIVAMGPQRLRLFARSASDASMVQCKWDAGAASCSNLGGWLWGGPDASSWGSPWSTSYSTSFNGEWAVDWTNTLQGLAHDATNWYWNDDKTIRLIALNHEFYYSYGDWMVGWRAGRDSDVYLGGGWNTTGNNVTDFHFGDADFYNGHLFVPIETKYDRWIAIFNPGINHESRLTVAATPQAMPMHGSFAWLAINPKDGLLYSATAFNNVSSLVTYRINPSSLQLTFDHTVPLKSYDGVTGLTLYDPFGSPGGLQGGAFSPNGHLYLSWGGYNGTQGVYAFDADGTLHNVLTFPLSGNPICSPWTVRDEEVEGMDIVDMSQYPASSFAGTGQIHMIKMNIYCNTDDGLLLHHWQTNGSLL